ncbi:SPOR domain-containing protein [Thermodesulfobacteriota bacterium]
MSDKNNNSNSEDKPYSDSVELFDTIFGKKKIAETPDSKKEYPPPDTPQGKTVQQKVPQKVKQEVEPQKKPSTKKTVPPVPSSRSKPSIEQDTRIKKTKLPAADPGKTVPQKVPQKAKQEVEPQKKLSTKETTSPVASTIVKPTEEPDISIKKPPSTEEKSVKLEIEKKLHGRPKKSLNPFIFASAIVVLVILSMFTGKVMNYDAIINFFNSKDSLKPDSETVVYDNSNEKAASVSSDLKVPSLEENVVKLKTEKIEIQGPDTIKEKQDTSVFAKPPPAGKMNDESSNVIKGEILSYPYSIYLGSLSTITKVKKASSDYTKMGLSPYWIKLDLGEKGVWFRLFVGYFQTRKEADEFIKVRRIQGAESKPIKYANLIGIYTSEEELAKQKVILEELEYSPYVISDTENVFRLYVGAFYQKVRAEEQNADMVLNGIKSQLVER